MRTLSRHIPMPFDDGHSVSIAHGKRYYYACPWHRYYSTDKSIEKVLANHRLIYRGGSPDNLDKNI